MTISSFSNLDELNAYYHATFTTGHVHLLDSKSYALIKAGYYDFYGDYDQQAADSLIESLGIDISNYTPPGNSYVYIGSKTSFRNNVHTFVVDSLYKRLFASLKKNGYIFEANGSYVILRKEAIIIDVFNDTLSPHANLDLLDNLVEEFKELRSDVKYYNSIVSRLLKEIAEKDDQIESLVSQLNDRQLSTWA